MGLSGSFRHDQAIPENLSGIGFSHSDIMEMRRDVPLKKHEDWLASSLYADEGGYVLVSEYSHLALALMMNHTDG